MIVPIPYVHAGIGLLCTLGAIPLVLRKVPMNRGYGIRIPKAFASESNWYEINAYGGKLFLAFGLFLLLFAGFTRRVAPPPRSPWAVLYLLAPLSALVVVLVLVESFARRLPDR